MAIELAQGKTGNEMAYAGKPGRPSIYADSASRVRAHRQAHARLDLTVKPETKASIESIAAELGFNTNEVVRELLAFALTNRNWKQVGLTGRGAL